MREHNFKAVLQTLNARKHRAFAKTLPWPYNGMINDLIGAIQTKGNYLATLGLACYTEICGRRIFFKDDRKVKDWKCFNKFLEYLANGCEFPHEVKLDGRDMKLYQAIRDGLTHEYFIKGRHTVISMYREHPNTNYLRFLRVEADGHLRTLVVVPYFKLFSDSLKRARDQRLLR